MASKIQKTFRNYRKFILSSITLKRECLKPVATNITLLLDSITLPLSTSDYKTINYLIRRNLKNDYIKYNKEIIKKEDLEFQLRVLKNILTKFLSKK